MPDNDVAVQPVKRDGKREVYITMINYILLVSRQGWQNSRLN